MNIWNDILRYSYVPGGTVGATSVAYLISDVGKAVNMEYGVKNSSASYSTYCSAFRHFGYTVNGDIEDYGTNRAIWSLSKSWPVLMRGENSDWGHAWVVDGYYKQEKKTSYYTLDTKELYHTDCFNRTFLHCNWGWGSGNGYYLDGAFQDFDRKLKIIVGAFY